MNMTHERKHRLTAELKAEIKAELDRLPSADVAGEGLPVAQPVERVAETASFQAARRGAQRRIWQFGALGGLAAAAPFIMVELGVWMWRGLTRASAHDAGVRFDVLMQVLALGAFVGVGLVVAFVVSWRQSRHPL